MFFLITQVQLLNPNRTKRIRILVVIATMTVAFLIFSFTLGKDLVEGREQSLQSFALLHFSGYLFFLLMPVELAFAYCVMNTYNIFLLIGIAYGTAICAQLIDYFLGYSISKTLLEKFFNPRKHVKAIRRIQKYGSLTIFIFNVFPLSSPIICLASGMIKYPLKKVVFFSSLGLLIKYTVIGLIVAL